MLDTFFLQILNMSFTASYVIIFVLLARLILQKTPKIFSYALWSVVLFRLVCPFSFESTFSWFSLTGTTAQQIRPFPETFTTLSDVLPSQGIGGQPVVEAAKPLFSGIFTLIWLVGIAALLTYSVLSLLKLRRRLKDAVQESGNIYSSVSLTSPFVMGLFRPKIYLPAHLTEEETCYILLHEQTHIKRLDHVVKLFSFFVLCLHWFNPLVWVAFFLSGRDMELSCDEAVIKKLGNEVKKDYSSSLLSLATGRRIVGGTPLAFGEGDTKSRIQNVLNYKKPTFWVIVVSVIAIVAIGVGLMANPKSKMPPTLYAYSEYGVIPMNIGTYSWNGVVADAISYTEMNYENAISYNEGRGHRNANIFFSTSNTPSDFNSDNAKGAKNFEIAEMKRYVNGKEEVLSEFDGNFIEVSLETDDSYLYEFKVRFGENYAYYSMKINNTVSDSAVTEDMPKEKESSPNFPIPEFGTKISQTVNSETGYEALSLKDVTREQAESYIKELQDNGWTAVDAFSQKTTVGGLYEKGGKTVSVQFAGDFFEIYFSETTHSTDNTAPAAYTMMKLGKNGEVLSSYSLKSEELADAILFDALSKSAAWEGVDVSTLEECYLIRQSFPDADEIHDYYAYRLADGTSVLQGGTNGRYSTLSSNLYLQLVDSFQS